MTTTIQNLSDLQDRRIMMDKKLPPYGYAFVILTGLFMIFLVIWSTQTNRIYVSRQQDLHHVQLLRLHHRAVCL